MELNANHEYDPTDEYEMQESFEQKMNENIDVTQQVVNQVLNILQSVDGGGCLLPHPISNLRKTIKTNPIVFQSRCRSFILGLSYYGSVLPVDVAFKNKTDIQIHTIVTSLFIIQKKIEQSISILSRVDDKNV